MFGCFVLFSVGTPLTPARFASPRARINGVVALYTICRALGARKGIRRWGTAMCPLDEALSRAVVDISSRPHADIKLNFTRYYCCYSLWYYCRHLGDTVRPPGTAAFRERTTTIPTCVKNDRFFFVR